MPFLLLITPALSTLAGGLLALRFRRSLVLLTAVGAGLLLGAAFLDLLPEAITLGAGNGMVPSKILGIFLLSLLAFLAIESGLDGLERRWENAAARRTIGRIGGSMLIFHSFRDGMAIGLSYAASHTAGYAVALGIAAHDIGDGLNTVILTTAGEEPRLTDYLFLAADCLAPILGGLLTAFWIFSAKSSVILLAVAAGFFLQMATSDFLPQVRKDATFRAYLFPAVLAGVCLIYIANLFLPQLP